MPTREGIQHFVDTSEPRGVQPGDEWWNIGTGRYYKRVVFSNGGVGWTEIAQPSLIVGTANTWALAQAFNGAITGTTAAFSGGITATTASFSGSATSDSMIIGSGRSSAVQAALDVKGQVRAPQYIIGNPISGSSITYGAATSNNLLPPPTFHGGTGALTSVGAVATGANPYHVAVDPTGRFAFLTNYGSDTVQAYTIDQSTGALTAVGSAIGAGTNPYGIAVDPTGRFAFVPNMSSATVQAYTINQSTGALTSVGAVATGSSPYFVAVDPTGRFVFVSNFGGNTVQSYTINQSTGALTSVGAVAAGSSPSGIAVEPTGRFAFVANNGASTIQAYTINQSTGALTSVGTAAAGNSPRGVAVEPTGRFAFVANYGGATVQAYTINQSTGALTSVGAVATGTQPSGVAADPTGRFVIVTNSVISGTVQAYTINQSTGALTSVGAVAAGSYPTGVAIDPTGRFVFVTSYTQTLLTYRINNFAANSGTFQDQLIIGSGRSSSVQAAADIQGQLRASQHIIGNPISGSSITYGAVTSNNLLPPPTFHNGTGALTSVSSTATGTAPAGVAVDPTGRFVFVANYSSATVQAYTINQSTGALTSVGTAATGSQPNSIAVDSTGRFAFVTNQASTTVQAYTINQSTGALTSVGAVSTGSNPWGVAVDPTGRFVFVANNLGNTVQAYTINQSTGALTSVGAVATGSNPLNVAVDPTGRFVFVGNSSGNTVQSYTIGQSTGALISIGTAASTSYPWGVAVDPTGRFAFAVNNGNNTIQSFTINQAGNQPGGLIATTSVATVGSAKNITIDPTGRFAFVTIFNAVQIYIINQLTGALTSVGTAVTGSNSVNVAVDPTGRFVFVTNQGNDTVQTYRINNFAANSGTFQDQLTIGTGNIVSTPAPSAVYVSGQLRAPQHIIGNPVSGSSITYGAATSNNLLPPPTFHGGTGALTSVGAVAAGTNSRIVAIDPSGRFAIVANFGSATVQPFLIDQSTGALTAGTAVAFGSSAYSVAIDPTGRYAYVCGGSSSYTVQPYTINQSTGALTAGTAVTTGTTPNAVAVDPTGRFVYVTNQNSATVQGFVITQSTGALTSVGAVAAGTGPFAVVVDTTGRFVFVANQGVSTVQTYTINQSTGALTSVGTVATGSNPRQLAVDPTGRFLFVTNYGSNTVQPFTINQSTGVLTAGTAVATGTTPHCVAADPNGRLVFVANSVSNTLQTYSINQSTGALTSVGTVATGTTPWGVAVDPTGRFVVVGNDGGATVQTYRINNFAANSGTFQDQLSIGTTTTQGQLLVSGKQVLWSGVTGTYPTVSSSASTYSLAIGGDSNPNSFYGLYMGVQGSTGASWISAQRNDGTAGAYSLLLNPVGGNVGIGTTSPGRLLDVNGTSVYRDTAYFGSTGVQNIAADTTTLYFRATNFAFQNAGATTTQMYLQGNNLGIGTATPAQKLEIADASNIANSSWAGGTNFIKLVATGNFSEQSIAFQENQSGQDVGAKIGVKNTSYGGYDIIFANRPATSATSTMAERMRIANTGNVGIGTSSPSYKLHLAGETSQNPVALGIAPSGHATSRRAALLLDTWYVVQDTGSVGTKDFGIYGGATADWRLVINTSGNVGIGTTSPGSTFHVSGSQSVKVSLALASTTLDATQYIITTATTGNIIYTLPDASTAANRVYIIKRLTTGTVTITPATGQYIETGAVNVSFLIPAQYDSYTFVSDGTSKWYIV